MQPSGVLGWLQNLRSKVQALLMEICYIFFIDIS